MRLQGVLSDKNTAIRVVTWLSLIVVLTIPALLIWQSAVGANPSVRALKTLQVMQTFVVFILPVLGAAYLWSDRPFHWLHLDKGMSLRTALLIVAMMLILAPGINLLSVLNQQLTLPDRLADIERVLKEREEQAAALTELFARADTIPQLFLNLFIMAVLPAIGEELCFRGACQGLFVHGTEGPYFNSRLRAHTHVAIWVTAILFSALHFQFYGFIPRLLLGALLGYLLCMSGSLYVPMLAHFTNNAVAVVFYYLEGKGLLDSEVVDTFGSGDTVWVGVLSLVIGGALLWLFVRRQSSVPRP